MTIGERIKAARLDKGYTQDDLAEVLQINKATVSRYENGKREPRFDDLLSIADALDVSIGYLQGFESQNARKIIEAIERADMRTAEKLLGMAEGSLREAASGNLSPEQKETAAKTMNILSSIADAGIEIMTDAEAAKRVVTSDADRLAFFFGQLNEEGQRVAADRVQELTEIPKYQKPPETAE